MANFNLKDLRQVFRLIGEVRELGADPARWRPHMVRRLRKLLRAEIVISSEIFVRSSPNASKTLGVVRIHDIGWGCDGGESAPDEHGHIKKNEVWRIHTERDEKPEAYWVSVLAQTLAGPRASAACRSAHEADLWGDEFYSFAIPPATPRGDRSTGSASHPAWTGGR